MNGGTWQDRDGEAGLWSRRRLLGTAVVAGASAGPLSALLSACSGNSGRAGAKQPASSSAGGAPRPGGTLTLSFNADVAGVASPLHPPGTGQEFIVLAVYDTLFVYDHLLPGFQIRGRLAKSWDVSADARQYTIRLRDDVVFHNGKPLDATDVAYTLEQNLQSTADMQFLLSPYLDKSGIKVLDTHTIQLNLLQPNAYLPNLLQEYRCGIFPNGTTSFVNPIGTGPFKFVSRSVGVGFQLTKNPHYFIAGQPYLDNIHAVVLPNLTSAVSALESGQIQWLTTSLPPNLVAQVRGNSSLAIVGLPNDIIMYILVNPHIKPFSDVRVRQALKLSVNRQEWAQTLWGGAAHIVADVPVAADDPLYPDVPSPVQNIAEAKRLLAEAGYPGGLSFTIATADDGPTQANGPVVLAQQALAAGFHISVKTYPVSTYYNLPVYGGPHSVSWTNYQNRRCVYEDLILSTGSNEWSPPSYGADLKAALGTTSAAQQKANFDAILKPVSEEGSLIVPVLGTSQYGISSKLRGIDANALSLNGYFGQVGFA